MIRVIVTGWRKHPDERIVYRRLDALWQARDPGEAFVVVHGDCPTGADRYAANWASQRHVTQERYPARDYGSWPACGPRRNSVMVAAGATVVEAFPGPTSRGTWDLIGKARAAGILVHVHPYPSTEEYA
jgi:SLOG family YspA-like protein